MALLPYSYLMPPPRGTYGTCKNTEYYTVPPPPPRRHHYRRMAGLAKFDQTNAIAAATSIAIAFKFCIRHRKNGLLNRKPEKVSFPVSTTFCILINREVASQSPQNTF